MAMFRTDTVYKDTYKDISKETPVRSPDRIFYHTKTDRTDEGLKRL